jgi:cytochrome P450
MTDFSDPFREKRREAGVLVCPFQGEDVPMILGYRELRKAAKDWHTYSSDAPFRVPIPSEEDWRSVRQLPIETDPPDHTEYRQIIEPFFRRPSEPEVMEKIRALIRAMVLDAAKRNSIEIVREFSLPLQSRALTILFNVPETEAEEWIGWGTNVFREGDGAKKGMALEMYINRQLDRAQEHPAGDFFSALTQATFRGRKLTRQEMVGFANLTFAGGRDTIIHTVSTVIAYVAENPGALDFLRQDPQRLVMATEEFVRIVSPLTHIGRVCKQAREVQGVPVEANGRVSLCWASANRDETVFEDPDTIRLDRVPNPHVGFGSGPHSCMGAPHARLILRTLLKTLCEQVDRIEIIDAEPHVEAEAAYARAVGYARLVVRMLGKRHEPAPRC